MESHLPTQKSVGIDLAAIRTHIEAKFEQATLEKYPFPHLIIEGFFPEEIFQEILAKNLFKETRGTEWISKKASMERKTKTPYYARKQINFHDENYQLEASPESVEFWGQIRSLFLDDDWFPQLVLKKYKDFFQLRFGELCEDKNFASHFRRELFLQRHEPGYYIGPHTDVPSRVFTCIFSYADQPGFEEYGTELLAHKDPMVRCWGNDHYPPDDFIVKKVAPYKPNNFLLFFKTRQSFHAVRSITEEVPNQRYGMQFQFYEDRYGVFKDLSEPDLMVTRHQKSGPKPSIWTRGKNKIKRTLFS